MTAPTPLACPICEQPGEPDDRRPAEIAGVTFQSVRCDRSSLAEGGSLTAGGHLFGLRWLEGTVPDADALAAFNEQFTWVRGPLPEGSAIAEAFDDVDPILAWIEHAEGEDGVRVLIRL